MSTEKTLSSYNIFVYRQKEMYSNIEFWRAEIWTSEMLSEEPEQLLWEAQTAISDYSETKLNGETLHTILAKAADFMEVGDE